ncbi:hypothetical protein PS712_04147 [Pseudomonas fluorescens]|uniref:Uncharacterized protein n=1 Tax=Pseudomonas fluorescens TaxID=294 RepID=A0A5E7DTQ5_PSEFL|nr:hypothetical protein [Pseudomonas fluorescens]VVO19901.1 hypothetical protein PS712_04147 [Pseudomonas fluorescens]
MKKIFALALMLVSHAALSDARLEPTTIDGLTVPGTPAIGKALGFTDCSDSYDSFRCVRVIPTTFYGAKANTADVFFTGKDNFALKSSSNSGPKVSGLSPDRLSYRGIRLDFDLEQKEKLDKALLADGWVKEIQGNSRDYYKSGVGVSVGFFRSTANLNPISPSEATSKYNALKAKTAEAEKAASNSQSFIDSMKK